VHDVMSAVSLTAEGEGTAHTYRFCSQGGAWRVSTTARRQLSTIPRPGGHGSLGTGTRVLIHKCCVHTIVTCVMASSRMTSRRLCTKGAVRGQKGPFCMDRLPRTWQTHRQRPLVHRLKQDGRPHSVARLGVGHELRHALMVIIGVIVRVLHIRVPIALVRIRSLSLGRFFAGTSSFVPRRLHCRGCVNLRLLDT
jgi:hypothetical protein